MLLPISQGDVQQYRVELDWMSERSANVYPLRDQKTKIEIDGLSFYYGDVQALKLIDLTVLKRSATALIGPYRAIRLMI